MDYTVEIHRLDKRRKDGMRLVLKEDWSGVPLDALERMYPVRPKYVRFIHETYVERKNIMTGELYKERYDVPWFASPSSETYWSA